MTIPLTSPCATHCKLHAKWSLGYCLFSDPLLKEKYLDYHYHTMWVVNSSSTGATFMGQWIGSSIGSDNGLSPIWRQAINWTNADIVAMSPQRTYFNEILFEIQIFSFRKMRLNMSSAKWLPFCPGAEELINHWWNRCWLDRQFILKQAFVAAMWHVLHGDSLWHCWFWKE